MKTRPFFAVDVGNTRTKFGFWRDVESGPFPDAEFADASETFEAVDAWSRTLPLDGGVSAAMVFMGEQLNTHMNIENKSQQRNLPDGLMWGYTEQCPLLTDPIYNDGIRNSGKVNIH